MKRKKTYLIRMVRWLKTVRCESHVVIGVSAVDGMEAVKKACKQMPGWAFEAHVK